ncbi:MAG: hypothetical protein MUC59_16750 [Saprospiraceae bacterium]|nr:hypothetical protein [Saprospiraceae bacterium]
MRKKAYSYGLSALLLAMFCACADAPPPTLAYKDREVVDSLFRLKVDKLKPVYDSLCMAHFDSAVQFKTDSMLKVRTAEIQQALERLRQETHQ